MILLFDMGLPMIIPTMSFMITALIPIVLVETVFIRRALGIRFLPAFGSAAFGNVISTLVGIPLTWCVLFAIQLITGGASSYQFGGFTEKVLSVTLQAPWLLPFSQDELWMFHAAALFLLIPFFFATWHTEYVLTRNILSRRVVEVDGTISIPAAERMVFKAIRNANLISYGFITVLLIVSFALSARGAE